MKDNSRHRHWLRLGIHVLKLYFSQSEKTSDLIIKSYNKIASGYDEAWTNHMQYLSDDMLKRLSPPAGAEILDLFCGTGYVTAKLAEYTEGNVIGVDASQGMLDVARRNHGKYCKFVHSDVMNYLLSQPSNSVDVVTCAWGLGYSKPFRIIREISRILRPEGRVGIIDNSLFTIFEVIKSAILTAAEEPTALRHVMRIRFLPSGGFLKWQMRFCGLHVSETWNGSMEFYRRFCAIIFTFIDTGMPIMMD